MSQPFELYDINGEVIVMASPAVAAELIEAGELFEAPPLVVEEEKSPPARKRRTTKKE